MRDLTRLSAYQIAIKTANENTSKHSPFKSTRELKCSATSKLYEILNAVNETNEKIREAFSQKKNVFSIAELDALLEEHILRGKLFPERRDSNARKAAKHALGDDDFTKLIAAYNEAKQYKDSPSTVEVHVTDLRLSFSAVKPTPAPTAHLRLE